MKIFGNHGEIPHTGCKSVGSKGLISDIYHKVKPGKVCWNSALSRFRTSSFES